jgi:CDP-diacylglycerol--serine O-phosphatidyltransferase
LLEGERKLVTEEGKPPEELRGTPPDSSTSYTLSQSDTHPTRLIWLPSAITTIALVAGFGGVILAADPSQPNRFLYVPLLVGLAVFCDGLDGRVARAVGASTKFGESFDSFADLIAFGVAPAFMIYQLFLRALPTPGVVAIAIAASFVFSNAFRLARFATKEYNPRYFEGLPTTAGGAFIASLAFWGVTMPPVAAAVAVVVTAILMGCSIQFPKPTHILGRAPYMLKWTLLLAIAAALVPFQARLLSVIAAGYIFYALVWSTERAVRRRFRRGMSAAAVGMLSGPAGTHFASLTTITVTDEDDEDDEDEPEEDWDDDWESEDEP